MIVESLTTKEALTSALESAAKSQNELRCAQADLRKAEGRVSFIILVLNTLIENHKGD